MILFVSGKIVCSTISPQ